MYKVIDNFVSDSIYNSMKQTIYSDNFPWFWQDHQLETQKDSSFFSHQLYMDNVPRSEYFTMFIPLLETLDCQSLITMRLNLLPKRENTWTAKHRDNWTENHKTAVFYFSTCNGKTVLCLDNETPIDSVENRVLKFNSDIEHYVIHQSDIDRRIVLNINYF